MNGKTKMGRLTGKRSGPLLAAILLVALSGCKNADVLPHAQEVENMALMRVMGVDAAEEGVVVTASSGTQSKGAQKGEESPLVLRRNAGTVSGACLSMQADGTAEVFYGHVGELLLGEKLARRGIGDILDYVERDIEMRLDTELYVVKQGTASQAIFAATTEKSSAVERLEAMEEDAGLMASSMPRSVKDVMGDLARNGASFVPAIVLEPKREGDGGEGKDGTLNAKGYAVFRGGTLVGWAEGQAAMGVNLLLGQVEADVLEVSLPGGGQAALRVVEAKTGVEPVFRAGRLAELIIRCRVEANLAQAPEGLDLTGEALRDRLTAALAEREQARVRAALELAQDLDADFLGLERRAGLAQPWNWADIQEQWAEKFAVLPITVQVEASLQRSYDGKG